MTDFYLVTGFLGAGKTTFLRRFVRLFEGQRLSVIVNEFGKINVDEQLLHALRISLRGVTGGSIFCACRLDQFERALIDAITEEPEVLIVETSGFTDPTAMRAALMRSPALPSLHYRGCIALADAAALYKLYETANVIKKQLSACDVAILNKMDLATGEQARRSMDVLLQTIPPERIFRAAHGEFPSAFAELIGELHGELPGGGALTADLNQRSLSLAINESATRSRLAEALHGLADCTYRVKGFVSLRGEVCHVDCVGGQIRVDSAPDAQPSGNQLTVLCGSGQAAERRITEMRETYPDVVG